MNYDIEMQKIIDELGYVPNLLLHSCCAPCSTRAISLLSDHFHITILYYNPNIFPEEEYLKRKEEQIRLIKEMPTKYKVSIIDCDYDNDKYNACIKGLENEPERGARCHKCYFLRMEKTASMAVDNYDFFATTLTLSPHKDANVLNKIGFYLEKEYNIKYLPTDFKKREGYKISTILSKKYNLYRQNYCGCIYSKRDEKNEKKETIFDFTI